MGAAREAVNAAGRIAPKGPPGRSASNDTPGRSTPIESPGRILSNHPLARIDSIDVLRGLAVLFMLEVHLGFWWARLAPESDPLVIAGTILGGTAAPLFLVLAGAGLAISKQRRPDGFLRRTAVRGALLLIAGIVFTLMMAPVYGPWGWGVLQCIGVSLLLAAPLMLKYGKGPVFHGPGPGHRVLIGLGLFIAAPLFRHAFGIPDFLWSDDMSAVPTFWDYLNRMMLSGFFPLLPWLGFVLIGTAAGEWLCEGSPRYRDIVPISLSLTLTGIVAAANGMPMNFFPPSVAFTLAVSGVVLLAMTLAARWHVPGTRVLAPLGRLSLTLFVAHHIIGYLGVRAAGGLNSLELLPDLVAVLGTWVICALVAWAWSKAGYRYSLEWLLSRAEGPTAERINNTRGNSGLKSPEE